MSTDEGSGWLATELDGTENDPFQRFAEWYADAAGAEVNDPNAMALATVDDSGLPNVRMVLLKSFDATGFVFFTNYESRKGEEILASGKAALVFHWKSLRRQFRARGAISTVSDEEADAYFASRVRASRIGAWASRQSRSLESRFHFEAEIARFGAKYALGPVPRPPYWSGFRIEPVELEFWQNRKYRLHDRVRFSRQGPNDEWRAERLFP